jgi:hypothetical protein
MVSPKDQTLRRRHDRRGNTSAAPGDPLAESVPAEAQGKAWVAVHDGDRAARNGGQALDHSHDGEGAFEVH